MLTQISIKNYGLIDQLSIELDEKLNILTGETGAGKSIFIGALRAALGQKMSTSQLRVSDKPCVIEVVFDLSKNDLGQKEIFEDFIDEDDPSLIIQRTLNPDGKNRIKINGQTVTVGQLKAVGNFLMDFHGPHDHQMLLDKDSHLGLLNQLCDFGESLSSYQVKYKKYSDVQKKINELAQLTDTRDRELDLLTHQIKELEQVSLNEEHYQDFVQQKAKVDNSQKLNESVTSVLELLDGGEQSSSESIRRCFGAMKNLSRLDEFTQKYEDELNQLQEVHESLVVNLRDYAMSLDFDDAQAEYVLNQNDLYDEVLRKFGPTIQDAEKFYTEAKAKHTLLNDLEHNDAELKQQLKKIETDLKKSADQLTKERQKRAKALKKTIESELKELGIAHVQFEAKIAKQDFAEHGQDDVEFYISPNAGEDLKPMAEIVSSGEAARVMLALKKALIEVDPIPVLVFDEIDAQIGGRLGTITGEKLRDIAQFRQVLLITHLPQIASFGNLHLKVTKSVRDKRSITEVNPLDQKQRVVEIAQMMSGENESDVSVKHAKDMLKAATK